MACYTSIPTHPNGAWICTVRFWLSWSGSKQVRARRGMQGWVMNEDMRRVVVKEHHRQGEVMRALREADGLELDQETLCALASHCIISAASFGHLVRPRFLAAIPQPLLPPSIHLLQSSCLHQTSCISAASFRHLVRPTHFASALSRLAEPTDKPLPTKCCPVSQSSLCTRYAMQTVCFFMQVFLTASIQ